MRIHTINPLEIQCQMVCIKAFHTHRGNTADFPASPRLIREPIYGCDSICHILLCFLPHIEDGAILARAYDVLDLGVSGCMWFNQS